MGGVGGGGGVKMDWLVLAFKCPPPASGAPPEGSPDRGRVSV